MKLEQKRVSSWRSSVKSLLESPVNISVSNHYRPPSPLKSNFMPIAKWVCYLITLVVAHHKKIEFILIFFFFGGGDVFSTFNKKVFHVYNQTRVNIITLLRLNLG